MNKTANSLSVAVCLQWETKDLELQDRKTSFFRDGKMLLVLVF